MSGLVACKVSKWFGSLRILDDVDIAIRPGRVVALIGHNGAGKSTLLRTLSGAAPLTGGTISVDGQTVALDRPADAAAAGISCVYQELSLIGSLSVAQNVFLGAEQMAGLRLDRRAMHEATAALCGEYGIPARPDDPVSKLPVAQRQMLEVARAIHRNARYLLLDEPTTALEQQQIERLLGVVRKIATERGIGVLLINHKLDEVFSIADDIVGLANGRVVLSGAARAVTREQVVEAIVNAGDHPADRPVERHGDGRRPDAPQRTRQADAPALRVRALAGNGLTGVDLDVDAGEIVGIYGLVGAGRSRFLRTLYGAEPQAEGEMRLNARPYRPAGPVDAIRRGVAFLSEERKSDGIVPQMSSRTNILIPVLDRFTRRGLIDWRQARNAAEKALRSIALHGDIAAPVTTLSGGNQQKMLLARALLQDPALLLLDEPTKGVDIGAKAEIYDIVRRFASAGRAVIVVSSEEEELLELADRIVVFRNGACDGQSLAAGRLTVPELRRAAWSHAS